MCIRDRPRPDNQAVPGGDQQLQGPKQQFVVMDMYEDREDCDIVAGVAIPSEFAEEFAAEVERLAVEKFGGATFGELLEHDEEDASMAASSRKNFEEQVSRVIAAAERIVGNGR